MKGVTCITHFVIAYNEVILFADAGQSWVKQGCICLVYDMPQ